MDEEVIKEYQNKIKEIKEKKGKKVLLKEYSYGKYNFENIEED